MSKDELGRVLRHDLCTGCGACAGLSGGKIKMAYSARGFLRPVRTPESAEFAPRDFANICPGRSQTAHLEGQFNDPLWGRYEALYKGHATDDDIRYEASSGGALTAVLVFLMRSGQIDEVLQVRADSQRVMLNFVATSDTDASVRAAAGSRYAPSAPLAEINKFAATGKKYAFVGKPCDVSALRKMIRIDPSLADSFPVLLSFFCAGVPSTVGGTNILKRMGVCAEKVAKFRYRGFGWPGRATATLSDGSERSISYHESWGEILSKQVQTRCKLCADGSGDAADIAFADAWLTDADGYPQFHDQPGTSAILARNKKGAAIVADAVSARLIKTSSLEISELTAMQPGQRRRKQALLARLLGRVLAAGMVPRFRGFQLVQLAISNGIGTNIRNCLGTLRRTIRAAEDPSSPASQTTSR